jgi:hypothetical protein
LHRRGGELRYLASQSHSVVRFWWELPVQFARGMTRPAETEWESNGSRIRISPRGRNGPLPATVACAVLSVFFFVEAFEPFSVFRLVLGLFTAALGIRVSRRWTLVVDRDEVIWHTVLRTRRWTYAEIEHFEVATRTSSSSDVPESALRVHLTNRRVLWLRGLEQPDLPDIAEHLNMMLRGSSRREVFARAAG